MVSERVGNLTIDSVCDVTLRTWEGPQPIPVSQMSAELHGLPKTLASCVKVLPLLFLPFVSLAQPKYWKASE